jgi:hypothetical protein
VEEGDILVLVALELAGLDLAVEEIFGGGGAVGPVDAGEGEVLEFVLDALGSAVRKEREKGRSGCWERIGGRS